MASCRQCCGRESNGVADTWDALHPGCSRKRVTQRASERGGGVTGGCSWRSGCHAAEKRQIKAAQQRQHNKAVPRSAPGALGVWAASVKDAEDAGAQGEEGKQQPDGHVGRRATGHKVELQQLLQKEQEASHACALQRRRADQVRQFLRSQPLAQLSLKSERCLC